MDKPVTKLEGADIAAVLKMLPHRYPFLMVDRDDRTCTATTMASGSRT